MKRKPSKKPDPYEKLDRGKVTLGRLEVTRSVARKILGGIAERTFATLESEGVIIPARRGRGGRASVYDVSVIVPAFLAYQNGKKAPTDRDARSRRDMSQAELNELRISKEKRELLPRQAIMLAAQNFVKALTAKVRMLPRRAVQQGLIERGQAEAGLAAMCRELQIEITSWKSIDDAEAVVKAAEETEAA